MSIQTRKTLSELLRFFGERYGRAIATSRERYQFPCGCDRPCDEADCQHREKFVELVKEVIVNG